MGGDGGFVSNVRAGALPGTVTCLPAEGFAPNASNDYERWMVDGVHVVDPLAVARPRLPFHKRVGYRILPYLEGRARVDGAGYVPVDEMHGATGAAAAACGASGGVVFVASNSADGGCSAPTTSTSPSRRIVTFAAPQSAHNVSAVSLAMPAPMLYGDDAARAPAANRSGGQLPYLTPPVTTQCAPYSGSTAAHAATAGGGGGGGGARPPRGPQLAPLSVPPPFVDTTGGGYRSAYAPGSPTFAPLIGASPTVGSPLAWNAGAPSVAPLGATAGGDGRVPDPRPASGGGGVVRTGSMAIEHAVVVPRRPAGLAASTPSTPSFTRQPREGTGAPVGSMSGYWAGAAPPQADRLTTSNGAFAAYLSP